MKRDIKVISVKRVKGSEINIHWRLPMQIVYTTRGTFVDNTPGSDYTTVTKDRRGFAWSKYINKSTASLNFETFKYDGINYIKIVR